MTGGSAWFWAVVIVQNNRNRREPPVNWWLGVEVLPKLCFSNTFRLKHCFYSKFLQQKNGSELNRCENEKDDVERWYDIMDKSEMRSLDLIAVINWHNFGQLAIGGQLKLNTSDSPICRSNDHNQVIGMSHGKQEPMESGRYHDIIHRESIHHDVIYFAFTTQVIGMSHGKQEPMESGRYHDIIHRESIHHDVIYFAFTKMADSQNDRQKYTRLLLSIYTFFGLTFQKSLTCIRNNILLHVYLNLKCNENWQKAAYHASSDSVQCVVS